MYRDIEPDGDGNWIPGAEIFDPATGLPRLLSEQCSTCVGRPGNLMHLNPGRLKQLIEDNTGDGRLGLICHQTLPYGDHPEAGPAFCRWFYDHYGHLANGIRHLVWDAGHGLDVKSANASAVLVLAFAVAATVSVWVIAAMPGAI